MEKKNVAVNAQLIGNDNYMLGRVNGKYYLTKLGLLPEEKDQIIAIFDEVQILSESNDHKRELIITIYLGNEAGKHDSLMGKIDYHGKPTGSFYLVENGNTITAATLDAIINKAQETLGAKSVTSAKVASM